MLNGSRGRTWKPALLEGVVVRRGDEVVAVDLAGLELLPAGVPVGDGAEDDLLDLGRLAPVVLVADDGDLAVADVPALELEGAGAGRVLEGVRGVAERVLVAAEVVGVVLLERRRALHREAGQGEGGREAAGHLRDLDDGRRLVGRLAALVEARDVGRAGEAAEHVLVVLRGRGAGRQALEVVPAVEVEADRLGVEVGAVGERHALAEGEGVLQPVLGDLVVLGQGRLDVGAAGLRGQQAVVDLPGDAEALTVGGERRVEHGRVAGSAEDERAAATGPRRSPRRSRVRWRHRPPW